VNNKDQPVEIPQQSSHAAFLEENKSDLWPQFSDIKKLPGSLAMFEMFINSELEPLIRKLNYGPVFEVLSFLIS
jgi:hypothetical protein